MQLAAQVEGEGVQTIWPQRRWWNVLSGRVQGEMPSAWMEAGMLGVIFCEMRDSG